MPAIITAVSLVVAIFAFPETLFSRDPVHLETRKHERIYVQLLFDPKSIAIQGRSLKIADFFYSFRMLRYPSVAFPVWWYLWCWTFCNILPALTMSAIYTSKYHFKTGAIGLCLGVPLVIGTLIGELTAGKLSDIIMYRLAKRHNGVRKPEDRLYLTTIAAFMMPAGIIMFGWCVQKHLHYIVPLIGLAMGMYCGSQCAKAMLIILQPCTDCRSRRPACTPTSQIATSPKQQRPAS